MATFRNKQDWDQDLFDGLEQLSLRPPMLPGLTARYRSGDEPLNDSASLDEILRNGLSFEVDCGGMRLA